MWESRGTCAAIVRLWSALSGGEQRALFSPGFDITKEIGAVRLDDFMCLAFSLPPSLPPSDHNADILRRQIDPLAAARPISADFVIAAAAAAAAAAADRVA